jgi:hypothetical protein
MSRRQFNGNGNLFSGNRRQIDTLAQERFQSGKDSRNDAGQEMVELIQTFQVGPNEWKFDNGNPAALFLRYLSSAYQQAE